MTGPPARSRAILLVSDRLLVSVWRADARCSFGRVAYAQLVTDTPAPLFSCSIHQWRMSLAARPTPDEWPEVGGQGAETSSLSSDF